MNNQFQTLRDKADLVDSDSHSFSTTYFGQLFKEEAYYWELVKPPVLKPSSTKIIEPEIGLEVLFLCSEFNSDGSSERSILEKMAFAMKLSKEEFKLLEYSSEALESNPRDEIKELVLQTKPKVVITFGAVMTNFILDKEERLSKVHGKFFPKLYDGYQTQVVPVFHPGFLIINPNMKRTAWMDLQKVMDFLGKLK